MLPDVVEYDEKMTGERREKFYYGLWAFLTSSPVLWVLRSAGGRWGYSDMCPMWSRQHMHYLKSHSLSIVPAVVILISLPFLIWYPIAPSDHAALVKELAERAAARQQAVL